jgi:hypothetical protein
MIHVTIQVDPLIWSALSEIAVRDKRPRSKLVRDALYSLVWDAQRGGRQFRKSLDCPENMHGQPYRLKAGKVVDIEAWGLQINDELRRSLEACQKPDDEIL